jgi:hypothetical protein
VIRHFDIRDLGMVQRLQAHARPLATHTIVVGGLHPLREAMRSYVAGGRYPVVCMVEPEGGGSFGMLRVLPDESSADVARQRGAALLLAAPTPRDEGEAQRWVSLVQQLLAEAAQRGAHHVVADVHEGSLESHLLQAAGFAPQMQQDMLKLLGERGATPMRKAATVDRPPGLRAAEPSDEPAIRALHLRSAPRLTWAAESSLDALLGVMKMQRGYVLVDGNEVVGHIGFWHGRRGRAMRCLFRPEHESLAGPALRSVLSELRYRRATYCCVRGYQAWLAPLLHELGFVHVSSNQILMRHTAARVQAPVWGAAPTGAVSVSR